jgi:D-serine deaminase-like pyridoxal phosphate-dependent protein
MGQSLGLGVGLLSGGLVPRSAWARPLARPVAGSPVAGLAQLPTPALVLDVAAFERNLKRMAEHARASGVGLRPHAKTHKCPVIARRQLELGAVGICCAKLGEAQVMVENGIDRVLITSPVATSEKFELAVALAGKAKDFIMLVDRADAARALGRLAQDAGIVLQVVIGLDTGTRRTGIQPGTPALELARVIQGIPSLRLRGLQAYAGHVMHIDGHDKRATASKKSLQPCLATRKLFEDNGIPVEIFTGGGTGTFDIDSSIDGVTDLQVGSYCFMDVQYRAIGDRDSAVFDFFEPSLFVLTTAISQPVPELITVDAGYKAFANEPNAKPVFADLDGMIYHYGGDEHGIVQFTDANQAAEARPLKVGDKARLVVSHCDPTINLYDEIHPWVDGVLESPWPILARGRSQ